MSEELNSPDLEEMSFAPIRARDACSLARLDDRGIREIFISKFWRKYNIQGTSNSEAPIIVTLSGMSVDSNKKIDVMDPCMMAVNKTIQFIGAPNTFRFFKRLIDLSEADYTKRLDIKKHSNLSERTQEKRSYAPFSARSDCFLKRITHPGKNVDANCARERFFADVWRDKNIFVQSGNPMYSTPPQIFFYAGYAREEYRDVNKHDPRLQAVNMTMQWLGSTEGFNFLTNMVDAADADSKQRWENKRFDISADIETNKKKFFAD